MYGHNAVSEQALAQEALDLAAEEILSIYKVRWNIETDLRWLKSTLGLHRLSEPGCCRVSSGFRS